MVHDVIEPGVIEYQLLLRAVNEQASGDAAELARKEGIDFGDVQTLRLDYSNILTIENLWQFERLTKLQLDNNIIERIENLDHLHNLTWLDLSFNNISKIENLDALTKLTDLSLFNNRIAKLENLDALTLLNVLSIGNNRIANKSDLSYLSRFCNLRVLNIAGNPLCKDPTHKNHVLARLKKLKYLDYRLIDQASFVEARKLYIDDVIAMEEEEKAAQKQEQERARQHEELRKLSLVFLSGIEALTSVDGFTAQHPAASAFSHSSPMAASTHAAKSESPGAPVLLTKDSDWQSLLLIAPEQLQTMQVQHFLSVQQMITDLTAKAFAQHTQRIEELAQFRHFCAETANAADVESRASIKTHRKQFKASKALINNFIGTQQRLNTFSPSSNQSLTKVSIGGPENTILEEPETAKTEANENKTEQSEEISDSESLSALFARMRNAVSSLFDELMDIEMHLVDNIEEACKELERNYNDMCNATREQTATWFARLRELQSEFHERLQETVLSAAERQAKSELEDMPETLRDLLRDKEAVINHIAGTNDHRLQRIDIQEEHFVSGIMRHQEREIAETQREEQERNRHRVLEILVFVEQCNAEIDLLEESAASATAA